MHYRLPMAKEREIFGYMDLNTIKENIFNVYVYQNFTLDTAIPLEAKFINLFK